MKKVIFVKYLKILTVILIICILLFGRPIFKTIKCSQLISKEVIYQIDLDVIFKNIDRLQELGYENQSNDPEDVYWLLHESHSNSGAYIMIQNETIRPSLLKYSIPGTTSKYNFVFYYDDIWSTISSLWEEQMPSFIVGNEYGRIIMGFGDPSKGRLWEQDLLNIINTTKD